jgi:hypothetical protein
MRTLAAIAGLGLVVSTLISPSAASESPSSPLPKTPVVETGGTIAALGGTAVTNGYFFPGTMTCSDGYAEQCTSAPPLQIPRGTDIDFVNLDPSAVTNAHQIVSFKRKRGRPLFKSPRLDGPARALMVTSHLKPGTYEYFCTTHFGMYGHIEVLSDY